MTYLKGETTWGNLLTKLVDLATGTVADDQGVTVAAAQRWRRTPALSSATTELVAPPASTDRTVDQEHRAGYWLRVDDNWSRNSVDRTIWMRQTACWSNWYTPYFGALNANQVLLTASVVTPNSIAGNYAGAQVRIACVRDDGSNSGTNATITLDANGNGTWTITAGYSMSFQLGSDSGILSTGAYYARVFTSTYKGGIDYFRHFGKCFDQTRPITWVTPISTGVQGADYESTGTLFRRGQSYAQSTRGYYELPQAVGGGSSSYGYWTTGWPTFGVGYKTDAALSGQRYVVRFAFNEATGQLTKNANGSVSFCQGGGGVSLAGVQEWGGGAEGWFAPMMFLKPFTSTPAAATRVQYWMSVTEEQLAIVLNADPGAVGTVTGNMIAKVESEYPAVDPGCWFMGAGVGNSYYWQYWYRLGAHVMYERFQVKGLDDDGRDWQTATGRFDVLGYETLVSSSWNRNHLGISTVANNPELLQIYNTRNPNNGQAYAPAIPTSTIRDNTMHKLADWKFGGLYLWDDSTGSDETAGYVAGKYAPRGYLTRGLLLVASGGWVPGDEVTDSVTGKKYTLFTAANGYGGVGQSPTLSFALEQV